ncbi:hypothetical protein [Streptomyces litmocidini]|uniref:hypothetical protein n=1 Tax=Streptomyces litmocidini TaxID=67318 RepID=UPI00167DB886|nr:hypothetical protein [Streptomyces litmocidini]
MPVRVERLVRGDAVEGQERAVQDRTRRRRRGSHGAGQGGGESDQELHPLGDVAEGWAGRSTPGGAIGIPDS